MIGETIGNFRVVKRLGAGGMGEVYLAEHKDLQTPVAVKLLNSEISNNQDQVQRFFNEARVVSKIKSAGTVKIFDSGFYNKQAYLIMELLEGESLATRIETKGSLPVGDVIDIARQIASVLDATHRQGVIHRDLKPDNIYIVHDDERASGERVKILDFGIAKLSGTLAMASPKTSGTMGTPSYMAPEQWGDSSKVDWRVDAYSLGCVMFEMACGRTPFHATNIAEAFVKHATEKPPTPSELVAGIPPQVDEVILRLLAKDPSERCASMSQVVRELAELAGEPMPPDTRRNTPAPLARLSPTPAEIARPLEGQDAISTAPSIPGAAPITQPSVRRASSHPAVTPTPTLAATTLGGSAAQLTKVELPPPKKKPLALIAGIGTAAVAAVVIVVVMVVNKEKATSPSAAGAPSAPATPTPITSPVVGAPTEPASTTAAPTDPATATAAAPTTAAPAATPPAVAPPAATPPTAPAAPATAAATTAAAPATTARTKTDTATAAANDRKTRRERRREAAAAAAAAKAAATTTATTATTTPKTTTTTTPKTTTTTTAPATTDGAGSGSATTGRKRFGGGRY